MKTVKLFSLLFTITVLGGCGVNDADVLKKYAGHSPLTSDNRAGICLELADSSALVFTISYSNPPLAFYKQNVDRLTERLYAVDALDIAAHCTDVKILTVERENRGADSTETYLSTIAFAGETAAKYALVCFKGIGGDEFPAAETPPCFFIVSLDRKNPHVLTVDPLAANALVAADYEPGGFIRYTEPQVYSGIVPFEKSKDVELKLTLSPDLAQVLVLELNATELYLLSANYRKRSNTGPDIEFISSGIFEMTFNGSGIASETFKGEIKTTKPFETVDGKIKTENVIACDLTVTDDEIHGTVKITAQGCATKEKEALLRRVED
jgi:hypothetical protein